MPHKTPLVFPLFGFSSARAVVMADILSLRSFMGVGGVNLSSRNNLLLAF